MDAGRGPSSSRGEASRARGSGAHDHCAPSHHVPPLAASALGTGLSSVTEQRCHKGKRPLAAAADCCWHGSSRLHVPGENPCLASPHREHLQQPAAGQSVSQQQGCRERTQIAHGRASNRDGLDRTQEIRTHWGLHCMTTLACSRQCEWHCLSEEWHVGHAHGRGRQGWPEQKQTATDTCRTCPHPATTGTVVCIEDCIAWRRDTGGRGRGMMRVVIADQAQSKCCSCSTLDRRICNTQSSQVALLLLNIASSTATSTAE